MPKVEGAGRKLSVELTMFNNTGDKIQVTCKFCNDPISAKIFAHMSKCKKHAVTSRLKADDEAETLNEMKM